jgi:hypothetical protein
LYTDASLKIIRITNTYLFIRVVAVIIVYVLYLAVWTGVDPQQSQFKPSIYYCASNSNLWLIFQGVIVMVFLIAGVILAIRTRNIPQLYNECRYIGLCVRKRICGFTAHELELILNLSADLQLGVLHLGRSYDKLLPCQCLRGRRLDHLLRRRDFCFRRYVGHPLRPQALARHSPPRKNQGHFFVWIRRLRGYDDYNIERRHWVRRLDGFAAVLGVWQCWSSEEEFEDALSAQG